MRIRFPIIILLALMLGGCAIAPMPAYEDFVIHKEDSTPEARPAKSLVYFFREDRFRGSAIYYYVNDENGVIGALIPGVYFYHWVDPGSHIFWSETEQKSSVQIEAKAGQAYYVEGDVGMGILVGVPSLTLVPTKIGENAVKGLKRTSLSRIRRDSN